MASGAEAIARRLHAAGCRHAFTIPGGEVLAIIEALDAVGIAVHLAKHENCAGFMAEGVHHHDGAPAILVATIGPGIANAANVIANAHQDRVPLIAITGCVPASQRHVYTHQVFDHVKLAEPITKAAFRVEAGSAHVVADKAVAIATEGRPGAVLLDVPIDVQGGEEGEPAAPWRARASPMAPAPGDDLETARRWLGEARRPLMIAGVDVLNDNAAEAVRGFVGELSVPLITTYKAKGVVDEDHPMVLGGAGLSPKADAILLALVEQADVIVLAGYDPIEMRIGWHNPWRDDQRVIELSAVANTHFMHQARLNFIAHVGAGLAALRANGTKPVASWPDGEVTRARQELAAAFPDDTEWGPAGVIAAAREALPAHAVASVDSGAHRILLSQMWKTHEPRGLLQSSALCTMGAAVPLAIGRKLAEPDRPVAAFVGDAGLEMFLGELATIRDMGLGIPIVVFVDESLALIELKQRRNRQANLAVDFAGTDFVTVARGLGGHGVWCDDRDAVKREIAAALRRDTFTVIAARISRKAYDGAI